MFVGGSERWIMSGLHGGSHPFAACALFEGFFSKPSLKSRNTIFTLGQRGAILSPAELEGPILVPHTAQRGDSRVGLACLTLTEQQKQEPQITETSRFSSSQPRRALLSLQYPYETLFRSQHYALLDNGCREFLFLSDFFMVVGNSALDLFNSIMGKTLSMFLVWREFHLKCSQETTAGIHLLSWKRQLQNVIELKLCNIINL